MNKIGLIIQREYLTRVKNKTFILSTFMLPIVMILFIVGSTFFAIKSREKRKVAVVNDPGFFQHNMKSDSASVIFDFKAVADSTNYEAKGYDGILYLPAVGSNKYELRSNKQFGLDSKGYIERQLNKAIENNMLEQRGIEKTTLDSISKASDNAVNLNNIVKEKNGESRQANAGLAYGVGFGSGILIYITMFIFGAMVMRGVAEEKMNRIAEVIVSSCKPFELMMGKIIGIAGVGLTQFLLWIILIFALMSSMQFFLPAETLQQIQDAQQSQQGMPGGANNTMALKIMEAKTTLVEGVNWGLIIFCFLFYFLGGYLFYAALFAAIGSVINEDPQEAQSLMLPITMPIIFGFIILTSSLQNPNSPVAVWASIIPFTSPIVMMGRIPFGVPQTVPYWQLGLSMVSLIAGFLVTTWFAGKVYRTGILMYGKKASWKEMAKWAFRK
ncbi:MAG TPA: ABC transporter permease [Chitinophagaceae bacterium]|nr:ABC transporter permease [Chitinophagaceae bacterium]